MSLNMLLKVLKIYVKIGNTFRILLFYWDDKSVSFNLIQSSRYKRQWLFNMITLTILYFLASVRFAFIIIQGKEPLSFLLLNTVSAATQVSGIAAIISAIKARNTLCHLLKCTTNFQAKSKAYNNQKPSVRQPISLELCCSCCFTAILFTPPIFSIVTFLYPCHQLSSSTIAYFYPQSCSSFMF